MMDLMYVFTDVYRYRSPGGDTKGDPERSARALADPEVQASIRLIHAGLPPFTRSFVARRPSCATPWSSRHWTTCRYLLPLFCASCSFVVTNGILSACRTPRTRAPLAVSCATPAWGP